MNKLNVKKDFADIYTKSPNDYLKEILYLLHQKGIDTKWLEDDEYFYANFYIATPNNQESKLCDLSQKLKPAITQ